MMPPEVNGSEQPNANAAGSIPSAPAPWPAPTTDVPVRAVIRVPGSKSAANRALAMAAIADGPGWVRGAPDARDIRLMIQALQSLGNELQVTTTDSDTLDIAVTPQDMRGPCLIDVGLAGTVMRFVPPIAVLAQGEIAFDGDDHARKRPMAALLAGLRDLGASVSDSAGHLPCTVHAVGELAGGLVRIDASASSQFVSGLLLAGCRYRDGVTIEHIGDRVPSQPHIDMTLSMLRERGVHAHHPTPLAWSVDPGPLRSIDCRIEPDLSNAAVFMAAALVTGGEVTIPDWPQTTTQAGDALRELLPALGAEIRMTERGCTVRGQGSIRGIDVDLHDVGELTPTIAALCVLADSPSQLRGIAHLRGHETDRLAALVTNIVTLGGIAEETSDGLRIQPSPLHGGPWRAYADHRMATAGAIIGLRVPGVYVDDIACTAKTLPHFDGRWQQMLSAAETC